MRIKRIVGGTVAVIAVMAGSGAAIAATGGDREQAEQAVLEDAAGRLDVTPEELRAALSSAQDAELDRAVEDGRLTREQADAIRERRSDNGRVLGIAPGGGHGPGHGHRGMGHGRIGHGGMIEDLAEALDMSGEELFEQLRSGQSIAEIAEAQEKELDDVRQAIRTAQEERLEEAVEAGRITESQRDELLERLDERIERLGEKTGRPFGGPRPDADDQDEAGSADEEAGFTS